MFSIEISRAVARTIFLHRATELPDGSMAFRLADDSGHVRVTKEQWEAAGQDFKAKTGKVKRACAIALWLWMPGYVVYAMISGAIIPHALFKALPYWLQITIFVGPLFATPFVIFGYWTYRVIQISKEIDGLLTKNAPRVFGKAKTFRPPFWLDIMCLMFVGPALIVDVYGQFNPDAFRNTPWTGRHIDWVTIAGFVLIATRLIWGWLAWRRNQAPQASL